MNHTKNSNKMEANELDKIANEIAKGFKYNQLTDGLKIKVLGIRVDRLEEAKKQEAINIIKRLKKLGSIAEARRIYEQLK